MSNLSKIKKRADKGVFLLMNTQGIAYISDYTDIKNLESLNLIQQTTTVKYIVFLNDKTRM